MVTSTGAPGQETQLVRRTEKKSRRLWKSFSLDPREVGYEKNQERSEVEDLTTGEMRRVESYGEVVPAMRLQLAEQGDTQAQLEVARELLILVAGGVEGEEVKQLEERAMYWLLRAAEQGSSEAVETIKSLSEEGRGVTDHNYVDVVNISTMPEDQIRAGYVGRKVFRSLSEGQDFVTTLQLCRLAGGDQTLPSYPQSEAKHSQAELVTAFSQYVRGDLPSIVLVQDTPVLSLLTSRILILMIVLTVYLYQVTTLQVSLWNTLPRLTCLSTLTLLSVHTLQTNINQRELGLWSSLVTVFSDSDTDKTELRYFSRRNLTPVLLSLSFLSLTGYDLNLRADEPLVWSFSLMAFIGCLFSALSIPRISKSFLTFLSLSLVFWTSQQESLLNLYLPDHLQLQPGHLAAVLSLLYFLPSLALQPRHLLLLELQARNIN